MSIPSLLTPTDIFLDSYHGGKRNADRVATHTIRSLFNKLCITPSDQCVRRSVVGVGITPHILGIHYIQCTDFITLIIVSVGEGQWLETRLLPNLDTFSLVCQHITPDHTPFFISKIPFTTRHALTILYN
jgi:hypothetical protein